MLFYPLPRLQSDCNFTENTRDRHMTLTGGESVMRRAFHSEGSFYRQLLYIVEPRQDGKYNQHTNAPWH